jgi:hypothetical protein
MFFFQQFIPFQIIVSFAASCSLSFSFSFFLSKFSCFFTPIFKVNFPFPHGLIVLLELRVDEEPDDRPQH